MKSNRIASILKWVQKMAAKTEKPSGSYRAKLAAFSFLLLGATFTTPALARHEPEYYCIFERENSSFQTVDVYPTTDRSISWACYEAERQCRRDLLNGQRCSLYSSGEFGYIQEDQRVLCESRNGKHKTCILSGEAVGTARIVNKRSKNTCNQGIDWDLGDDGESIWVDNGCRAVFEVKVETYKEPGIPPQIEARDGR
jgi:hypothetical protein